MSKFKQALPLGTVIDRYRIEKLLGGGGFSLVYLCRNQENDEQVVVKEYMPSRLARRAADGQVEAKGEKEANRLNRGRTLFFQEAAALAALKHPNIVRVLSFFRANNTVYMVMEYQEGRNLQQYLKERGGRLSERFLRTVFPPLLDGLETIHGNELLHLDIKPGNIHIRPGGSPLLLDFGAVHGFPQARQSQPGQVVSPGFSPYEQYETNGYVGPWSDIYAFGATMRACIEGKPPPPARERYMRDTMKPAKQAFRGQYAYGLLCAIDWAMEVDPLLRPQSVAEFREALLKDVEEPEAPDSTLGRLVGSLWNRG